MEVVNKHAFLIIAHNNFEILTRLLKMLDDKRNDIFIHIDKKVKGLSIDELKGCVSNAGLYFTKRLSVYWGHSSQVECELLLLSEAINKGRYSYLHLLSGVDLPIKTQDYIHAYFDSNPDKQFLQVGVATPHLWRLSKYNFTISRKDGFVKQALSLLEVALNDKLKLNRLNKYGELKVVKTSNWFSITDECARYLVSKKKLIKKLTRFTVCADEMFLGTVIFSSVFASQVYKPEASWTGHMRYIDRIHAVASSPHTLTIEDKGALDDSQMLFARKFDYDTDAEIVEYIYNKYKG